jgi:phosphoribosylformimino-5-aminoimidazole carboxamide ribonucleotide (ProFAR) isomerase
VNAEELLVERVYMSSSRNWSHNSFEDAMKKFVPLIKFWWMEYMKVIPVNYSEWSDTIYVIVEFELNQEGLEMARGWNYAEQVEVTSAMSNHLRKYFNGFLNTNIQIKEFRRSFDYTTC